MKRWAALAAVILIAGGALWLAERRKADAPVSARSLLHFVADSQRELSRLPMSATALSDEEEIRVGNELLKRYAAMWPSQPPDAQRDAMQKYVERVGGRVAVRAHRKLPYTFHLIPDEGLVNAFALPGGPVFIGEGMLSLMDSEDELASVLAHEVEHIDHGHCAERVQLEARTHGLGIFRLILQIPLTVFQAGYSKDQELQADAEGTRLMVVAGYSPNGSVRLFETFDRLYEEHVSKARTPQDELTQVALETLSGYFRSHPPASERAEQVRRLIEDQHWPAKPEHDLEIGYILWSKRAQAAFEAHHYARAQALAEQALKARPGYMKALWELARAEAWQGEFAAGASAIRQMLDAEPHNATLIGEYAQMLAHVPNHAKALHEFQAWAKGSQQSAAAVAAPNAGLQLLAGDPKAAAALVAQAQARAAESSSADLMAQFGWWYYQAGEYKRAWALLSEAQQRRPDDGSVRLHLAWAEIEVRRYADALADFGEKGTTTVSYPPRPETGTMGRAVALWLSDEHDSALLEFAGVYGRSPEWKNPRWVRPMYSPTVWRVVSQMAAERERRSKKPQIRAD